MTPNDIYNESIDKEFLVLLTASLDFLRNWMFLLMFKGN